MKRIRHSKTNNATRFIKVDAYTWIEAKADEPDEVARKNFQTKLMRYLNNPNLKPGN